MAEDELNIPDFLKMTAEERAAFWVGFKFIAPKNPIPTQPKKVKPPKPPKVARSYPKVDTTGKRWDGHKGRWVPECTLATVGEASQNQPAPTVTRSCIELDATITVLKPNPRVPGTGAHERFEAMRAYVEAHPGTTVGDVLANTSYRKDDYAWDLRKGNVK